MQRIGPAASETGTHEMSYYTHGYEIYNVTFPGEFDFIDGFDYVKPKSSFELGSRMKRAGFTLDFQSISV